MRTPSLAPASTDHPAPEDSIAGRELPISSGARGRGSAVRAVRAALVAALVGGAVPACFVQPREEDEIFDVPFVSAIGCWDDVQCDDGNPCTRDTCLRKDSYTGACRFEHTPDAVPDDLDPCTVDSCVGGVPRHTPAAQGTPCGESGQLACDGKGACVGCSADPGACGGFTECLSWGCEADACVLHPAVKGLVLEDQIEGDCTALVCDGHGGVHAVWDEDDPLFVEVNPCVRLQCGPYGGQIGQPGTPCGDGCFRVGAQLVASQGMCGAAGDCGPSSIATPCLPYYGCENGQCKTSCAKDADCDGVPCKDGACGP